MGKILIQQLEDEKPEDTELLNRERGRRTRRAESQKPKERKMEWVD